MEFNPTKAYTKEAGIIILPPGIYRLEFLVEAYDSVRNQKWEIPLSYKNPNWSQTLIDGKYGYKPKEHQVAVSDFDCYSVLDDIKNSLTSEKITLSLEQKENLKEKIYDILSGELCLIRSIKEESLFRCLNTEDWDEIDEAEQEKIMSCEPFAF